MIRREDIYKIGKIGKPHGFKGELGFSFTDDVFDRTDADYLFVEVDGLPVPFFIEEYRFMNAAAALLKFSGIDTEVQAARLSGCAVYFPIALSDNPDRQPDWDEFAGYAVIESGSKKFIGTVKTVDVSTQNTLFEVLTDAGKSVLLPANADLITHIDVEKKQIMTALPAGILDL